jgi:hypothetical protein
LNEPTVLLHPDSILISRVASTCGLLGDLRPGERRDASPERKANPGLWSEAKRLANGSEEEKIQFVDLTFDRYYELPKDADELILNLSRPNEPEAVRIRIAERLRRAMA